MKDIIQTGFIILSMILAGWYLKADITKEIKEDIRELRQELKQEMSGLEERVNSRFDRIENRLDRIEKNHLDHIITFHSLKIKPEDKK